MSLSLTNDPLLLVAITAFVFFLAGCMKGIIGMGLPTLAIALLGLVMTTYEAAALLVLPAFMTNIWQFFRGPTGMAWESAYRLVTKLWPMLLGQAVGVIVAWQYFKDADAAVLAVALGLVLVAYCVIGFGGLQFQLAPARQQIGAPLAGTLSGLITGVSGTMVIPAVMYLQTLGLKKDQLVQAMGLSFSTSSLVLGGLLVSAGRLDGNTSWLGLLALTAACAGMPLGQWLRQRLSERIFRRCFFGMIGLIGVSLILRNI